MSDDERKPIKRTRHAGDHEARLLIASKHAGSVIGKGGAIISRLRKEHQASINIPDCPGPERIVSMAGSEEAVVKLIEDVIHALDDSMPMKGEADVRLLVHQSQCGAIIGKQGARVKELRDICGGQVKVFQGPCPQSTDRVVQVTGEVDRVCITMGHILESLGQCPIKGIENPYNPYNAEDMFANEYGGWGDPNKRGGSGGFGPPPGPPMGGDFRGGRGPMPPHMGGGGGMGGGMGGGGGPRGPGMGGPGGRPPMGGGGGMNQPWGGAPGGGRRFDDRMGGGPRDRRSGGGFGRGGDDGGFEEGGRGGFNNGYGGGPNNQSLMSTNSENLSTTTQVTIPKEAAGAIIGKSGQRIRNIRFESGCTISIEDCRPGSDDRIITITGTEQQIKHAQYLLQQSVREFGPEADRRTNY